MGAKLVAPWFMVAKRDENYQNKLRRKSDSFTTLPRLRADEWRAGARRRGAEPSGSAAFLAPLRQEIEHQPCHGEPYAHQPQRPRQHTAQQQQLAAQGENHLCRLGGVHRRQLIGAPRPDAGRR